MNYDIINYAVQRKNISLIKKKKKKKLYLLYFIVMLGA